MLPVRLQRDINRYYISFISQVIVNNVFLAQITQIRKFGPRPLTISVFGGFFILSCQCCQYAYDEVSTSIISLISQVIANNAFLAQIA